MTRPRVPKPVRLGLLMFVNYGLTAASFRLLAAGSYLGVALVDAAIAWWGFAMIKSVAEAQTPLERFGYVAGGIAGSMVGMWLTRGSVS